MKRTGLLIAVLGLFLFAQAAQADWTPAKRLTWTSGSSEFPAIGIGSNNHIHVVWDDDTSDHKEIYYKRSTDGGTTWSASKRLTWNSGWSRFPALAIDSSNVIHVAWHDDTPGNYEIYYKKSADGGMTWSAAQRLTWASGFSFGPAIVIDSKDAIHIVWYDNTSGDWDIYYKGSVDGGTSWGATKRLTWTLGESYDPVMAVDSNNTIHLVWWDGRNSGNTEIYYKKSTAGGASWSTDKRLTWTSGASTEPAIAIDLSNAIHVVWDDYYTLENSEIYYKRSTNGGTTWSGAQRLTWTSGVSWTPVIAADSGDAIHVLWEEEILGTYDMEVFYRKSTDGGTTWDPAKRLTWNSGNSPAIGIDSTNTIHVVWTEYTPQNGEIYYKKYIK